MVTRRILPALIGGTAVMLATTAPAAAAPAVTAPATGLRADLDAILNDERLRGAQVAVQVRDARTGEVHYDRTARKRLMPASNMKLYTSAAALAILGPDHRFRTSVHARGAAGPELAGNLYLKGTGDPTMREAEYDRLAARVAAKGITRVTGDLVADDRWFDARRTNPGWDPADFQYAYAARISALNVSPGKEFNVGSVRITVSPGKVGEPVEVGVDPPTEVVKIDNRAATGRAGGTSTLSIDRPAGENTIVVTGSHPAGGEPVQRLRTVQKPTLYAADVFRDSLKEHGVTVAGTTRRGRTPGGAGTLALGRSMPLSKLVVPFLKLSNNMIAEILVKAIGRERRGAGSWRAGLPVIEHWLGRQGISTGRLEMIDGSGLARANRTTPQDIGTMLRKARSKSWFPSWYRALPVAGRSDPMVGGTLAGRMRGTPAEGTVHAKTGTLTGATALSGYVRDPSGRRLIFSIMFNGYEGGAPKDIEDEIAVRLAGGDGARTATARRAPASGRDLECSWTMSC